MKAKVDFFLIPFLSSSLNFFIDNRSCGFFIICPLDSVAIMIKQLLFYIVSFLLVAFGQPAWLWWGGLLAACMGYAIFWYGLNEVQSTKARFWIATLWFSLVQCVQLSWFVAHPYLYIWAVYFILSFTMGLQFGWLSLFVRPVHLEKVWKMVGIAGFWTLLEWVRLYVLSGFSWNPVGLAMSGSLYPLQLASVAGIYGLSFWVILVNLLALRAVFRTEKGQKVTSSWVVWAIAALIPYIFGFAHVLYHDSQIKKDPPKKMSALLLQTAFPVEECIDCPIEDMKSYVLGEWRQIVRTLREHHQEKVDLIALPEFVVPFGTWSPVYPWTQVKEIFADSWGVDSPLQLPPLEEPWATYYRGEWYVSNAFFLQGLSNLFHADVIAGLEDADQKDKGVEHYNAALVFEPWTYGVNKRYEKRVLVPMGEYIPFEFCRTMAQSYGIGGSFTAGTEAKIFEGKRGKYGLSICYEETYAHLMRENKLKGAEVLINLTSDVWYPNSKLPRQHLDHARLRSTEGGLPLLRACNTGVTCSIDSLGRDIASLGDDEWKQAALHTEVSLYTYPTLYTYTGDTLLIAFSGLMTFFLFISSSRREK